MNPCSTVSRTRAEGPPETGAPTIDSEAEEDASSNAPLRKEIDVTLMPETSLSDDASSPHVATTGARSAADPDSEANDSQLKLK